MFNVHDKVHFDADTVLRRPEFAGTFEVEKVNKVNVKVRKPAPPGGRAIVVNVNPIFLVAGEAPDRAEVTAVALAEYVAPGTVVYVDGTRTRRIPTGLYVITGETRGGFQMSTLGGKGTSWGSVPRAGFTVIAFTDDMKDALTNAAHGQIVAGV